VVGWGWYYLSTVLDGYGYGLEHLEEVMEVADSRTSGWAYWAYDRGGGWDLIAFDGSEKDKVDVLVRTYPRRIAGKPLRYSYQPASRVFELHFADMPGVTGPTVIYLPARRFYPEGWQVTSSDPDGAWSSEWDPDRELLSVTADPAQDRHTISISPAP
jgi:endoglycosylceramidase